MNTKDMFNNCDSNCIFLACRFFGRDSGLFKFQIHAGILARGNTQAGRRLVAFTFHPSSPFAISVQRANAEYLVNFHLRLDTANLCTAEHTSSTNMNSNTSSHGSRSGGATTSVIRPLKRTRPQ